MLESEGAHLDSRILVANKRKRQCGYSEDASAPAETGSAGGKWGATTLLIHKAGPNLGSLIGALIFFFTVLGTFALGIFTAYASVVGILRALAPRPQPARQSLLAQNQAHAAHAGGD
jgi:hypothetical protein